jgi:PAS domain-containing protein
MISIVFDARYERKHPAVMAYALATDVARSVELSKQLGRSEVRMQLTVEAAGIGLWEWDIVNDRIHLIHGDRVFGGTRQISS